MTVESRELRKDRLHLSSAGG